MASKSRIAQETLAELEKSCAPFEDQIVEAWKFIGVDPVIVGRSGTDQDEPETEFQGSSTHGREEWLLRWLLKKLQSPTGEIPRTTALSWKLLSYLIQTIPITNSAQILSERKFIILLRQALEETQKAAKDVPTAAGAQEPSSEDDSVTKSSKKRKRSGQVVVPTRRNGTSLQDLLQAIHAALSHVSKSTKVALSAVSDYRSTAFAAEYMKTVVSTTAEESAKILGLWLSLSRSVFPRTDVIDSKVRSSWLSPFVEVWEVHTIGNEDLMQFSLHCSQPLLALSRAVRESASSEWASELERLVARNTIIPAKVAKAENAESDLLSTLTRVSIIQESSNASLLFDVAVRSLHPTSSGRRRPQDDTWLQTVFTTLREAMPPKRIEPNRKAIQGMLQRAIDYKVAFDLSTLRSVTKEFALSGDNPDWGLLSTLIKLDANTFLIPNEEGNLLQELLTKITKASLSSTWSEVYQQVVADVTIPLMREFAKARDLSGFVRHWYAQLAEFERLRKEALLFSMVLFSAWEDDSLQSELSKQLEPSLTGTQIVQLVDWLSMEVKVNPDAVCVILDGIAGSIGRDDVIDAVGLQLYHIMFDNEVSEKLDGRYKWRSWRLLSRTLSWIQADDIEEFSRLWEENRRPFTSIGTKIVVSGLLEIINGNTVDLETLEVLKFACTAWSIADEGSRLQTLARKPMLSFLHALAREIKLFPQDLKSGQELGEEKCGSDLNTLYRGVGWMMWSFVRCILVEHPKVLPLGLSLPELAFNEMLQSIFWVASSVYASLKSEWLRINPDAFSNLWKSSLADEFVQNSRELTDLMIDTMLSSKTYGNNSLVNSPKINSFAIRSLLEIPLEKFTRKDRERIMKAWLPDPENEEAKDFTYESTVLDHNVLSLKVKIMGRPTFYEGMNFSDLVHLAGALSSSKFENLDVNLGLFKELARLTLFHLTSNLDQARDKQYASEAFNFLKKETKSKKSEDKKSIPTWDFAMVALFEVVITALNIKAAILNDLDIISNKDLTKVSDKFKSSLIEQLHGLLQKPKKFKKTDKSDHNILLLVSITDALAVLGVEESVLAKLAMDAKNFIVSLKGVQQEATSRVETLLWSHLSENSLPSSTGEGSATVYGRQSIREKMEALTVGKDQVEKLELLNTIAGPPSPLAQLDHLLAARSLIISCEDFRRSANDDTEEDLFDLCSAYADLCGRLWKTDGFRQFALVGETMEMMLRTKGRAISQWNIDSTLGGISILCSRKAPQLRPLRSGSIYLHLCRLLQAILTSHRLKLQGHFHLVVQSMQALLRCLFTPLPHSTSKITRIFAPPPWLSEPKHQLHAKHAEAYTRLITLICDPSVSSVTRSQQNNLTSATEKAKRVAGQHMQYVLTLYIKLQLEMKMLPEVREKMVPGIYAILDTTTPELRRAINEGLDSSGRAVFGTLYRDYSRFGKWKGS